MTVEEERLKEETGAVGSLGQWERQVLKEVDPNYDPSDSEDENGNPKPKKEPVLRLMEAKPW